MLVRITLKSPQPSDEVFVRRLLDNPAVESVDIFNPTDATNINRAWSTWVEAWQTMGGREAMEKALIALCADQHNVDKAPAD